jgi:hypothetical protein
MHPPRPLVGCAQLHPKLVVLKASDYRRDRAQTPTTTSTQLGRASGEFQASCLGSRARRTHRQAQRAAARFRIEEAWHAWPILSVGDCSLRVSLIHLLLVDIVYPAGDREPLTESNKPLRRDCLHRMKLRLHTSYVAIGGIGQAGQGNPVPPRRRLRSQHATQRNAATTATAA